MKVSDFMTSDVVTCHYKKSVEEAAKLMLEKNFSTLPIVNDDNELIGVLTQSDFAGKKVDIPHALASIKELFGQKFYFGDIETIYSEAKKKSVEEVMTKNPTTLSPETSLSSAVKLMIDKGLKRFPVTEGKKVVGLVTRKDLLKAFLATK